MPVQTQLQQRRGTAASWTSTNPTLAAGEIGFETDTGKFKIGNGSTAWAALAYSAGATAVTYLFNATSGQTTFSGADANGLTLAYTVGAEQVYLNGVLQVRGSDYTATNGTSIVLTSGALTSDVLNVIAYSAMTITDTYTQAQADAKFVQQTNNFFAGKNKIINGDFSINQRSFTSNSSGYNFDRFQCQPSGATATASAETFTLGTAPVAGYEGKNFLRWAVTVGNDGCRVAQHIESVRTLAGQTATLSFWAKGTNPTTVGNLKVGVQQNFGTGGSPSSAVDLTDQTLVLTASWTRYSFTFAIPSIAGKTIGTSNDDTLRITIGQSSSTSTDAWTLDIWGVQIEAGSIATPFQTATGTIAGELAACQRYYYRQTSLNNNYENFGLGMSNGTTTAAVIPINLPATMRTAPTSVDYSTLRLSDFASGNSVTSLTIDGNHNGRWSAVVNAGVASGLTAYRSYALQSNNSTSGYIGFSAEL